MWNVHKPLHTFTAFAQSAWDFPLHRKHVFSVNVDKYNAFSRKMQW